jgi:hypothetical protein
MSRDLERLLLRVHDALMKMLILHTILLGLILWRVW